MGNLRLLHLEVRPVFLNDGGDDDLMIQPGEPFLVPAYKVATFSEDWARDFKIAREQHDAKQDVTEE